MSTKKILQTWIDYRRDCVHSIYNNILVKLLTDFHMNQVLMMIFNKDNAEATIKIAKESKDKEEMQKKLIKKYGITTLQAETISNMRVSSFNKNRYQEYLEKDRDLSKKIEQIEKILDNEKEIDKVIIGQLEEGIKLFGGPRKSKIIQKH